MSRYGTVLFDLDGTLTDPKLGITRSVQYALRRLGRDEPDAEKLIGFIGPPLAESFAAHCGFDQATAWQAVLHYREYFAEQGIFENGVYAGIPELLARLAAQGTQMVVATSKPTPFAERVLDHFGLRQYFAGVFGSNLDGSLSEKAEIIALARGTLANGAGSDMVMVGDRRHDVQGAHANAIHSIAVAYGYGTLNELREARPTHIVHTVAELDALLM